LRVYSYLIDPMRRYRKKATLEVTPHATAVLRAVPQRAHMTIHPMIGISALAAIRDQWTHGRRARRSGGSGFGTGD
jgi:hypothetical protein